MQLRKSNLFVSLIFMSMSQCREVDMGKPFLSSCYKMKRPLRRSWGMIDQVRSLLDFAPSTLVSRSILLKTIILLFSMRIGVVTPTLHMTDFNKINNRTKDMVCLHSTLITIKRINQAARFLADLNSLMDFRLEILEPLFTRMAHQKRPIWEQENYLIQAFKLWEVIHLNSPDTDK